MGDIKLFRINEENVVELEGHSFGIEKSMQTLFENHLEDFFGICFLATEYYTGKTHGGYIDTLGLDENNMPVIIEYKRAMNQNVINQGLFYLDWLLDHKGEFTLKVMRTLGNEAADSIDWSSPRLLCIAGDFTRYDEYAIHQINRNIELFRYRRYGDDLILFELINATQGQTTESDIPQNTGKGSKNIYKTVTQYLEQASVELQDRYESLKTYLLSLGDDVQIKTCKNYFAFKRIKNFACVEVHPQTGQLLVYLKVDPKTITLEDGFSRDVIKVGHYGTGDLELRISSNADLEKAKELLIKSYEMS